jgi:hypothetical protein
METQPVGLLTTPPDAHGWQTEYQFGIQGDELVVIRITIMALTGTPTGGLTAAGARSLIQPGLARREFLKGAAADAVRWPMRVSDAQAMVDAHAEGRGWKPEPTAEFLDYVAWLRNALPVFRPLVHGEPVDRRQRILNTAVLYVEAVTEGHAAPRKRVAERQQRSESAVRDDLHAARHEDPRLLEVSPSRGRAGGALTEAARELLRVMQDVQAEEGGEQ